MLQEKQDAAAGVMDALAAERDIRLGCRDQLERLWGEVAAFLVCRNLAAPILEQDLSGRAVTGRVQWPGILLLGDTLGRTRIRRSEVVRCLRKPRHPGRHWAPRHSGPSRHTEQRRTPRQKADARRDPAAAGRLPVDERRAALQYEPGDVPRLHWVGTGGGKTTIDIAYAAGGPVLLNGQDVIGSVAERLWAIHLEFW